MKKLALLILGPTFSACLLGGCIETYDDDCAIAGTCEPTGGNSSTGGMGAGGGDGDGGDVTGGTSSGGGTQLICDPACSDDTPICDEAAKKCVACLKDDECEDDTPYCDLGSNECVGCLETDDCTSAEASVCSAGACEKCSVDDDCSHIEGKKICDEGACVECTADNTGACGVDESDKPFVCDVKQSTCSSTEVEGGSGLCSPCLSNEHCDPGQACVMQVFQGQDVGYFCFWEKGGGGGAPVSCGLSGRPYADTVEMADTINGTQATICGLAETTCPALNDYREVDCAPSGTPDDALCGEEGLDDGLCKLWETGPDLYRCTVPCVTRDDCKGSDPLACKSGAPDFCGF